MIINQTYYYQQTKLINPIVSKWISINFSITIKLIKTFLKWLFIFTFLKMTFFFNKKNLFLKDCKCNSMEELQTMLTEMAQGFWFSFVFCLLWAHILVAHWGKAQFWKMFFLRGPGGRSPLLSWSLTRPNFKMLVLYICMVENNEICSLTFSLFSPNNYTWKLHLLWVDFIRNIT